MTDCVLPLVAFDWSLRCIHVTSDGCTVTQMPDVHSLLDGLDRPHRIVAESTFESWDANRRQSVLDRMSADGHEFRVYRPLRTAKARKQLHEEALSRGDEATAEKWDPGNKSDSIDACLIYEIATNSRLHLYAPKAPDTSWASRAKEANREYAQYRLSGQKGQLVQAAQALIGPYRDKRGEAHSSLTEAQRVAYGNGSEYNASLLAACYFAAGRALNRLEFERLLGLQGSGYPSLLRSEVHRHSFHHARGRISSWIVQASAEGRYSDPQLDRDLAAAGSDLDRQEAMRKAVWRLYRREVRKLYQAFKRAAARDVGPVA